MKTHIFRVDVTDVSAEYYNSMAVIVFSNQRLLFLDTSVLQFFISIAEIYIFQGDLTNALSKTRTLFTGSTLRRRAGLRKRRQRLY